MQILGDGKLKLCEQDNMSRNTTKSTVQYSMEVGFPHFSFPYFSYISAVKETFTGMK